MGEPADLHQSCHTCARREAHTFIQLLSPSGPIKTLPALVGGWLPSEGRNYTAHFRNLSWRVGSPTLFPPKYSCVSCSEEARWVNEQAQQVQIRCLILGHSRRQRSPYEACTLSPRKCHCMRLFVLLASAQSKVKNPALESSRKEMFLAAHVSMSLGANVFHQHLRET